MIKLGQMSFLSQFDDDVTSGYQLSPLSSSPKSGVWSTIGNGLKTLQMMGDISEGFAFSAFGSLSSQARNILAPYVLGAAAMLFLDVPIVGPLAATLLNTPQMMATAFGLDMGVGMTISGLSNIIGTDVLAIGLGAAAMLGKGALLAKSMAGWMGVGLRTVDVSEDY